jgi:PAS domain S-box-containing protein
MAEADERGTKPSGHGVRHVGEHSVATGTPSMGEVDGPSLEPLGQPGLHHWSTARLDRPGLDDRDNVFFVAVEMTRMPIVLADPRQHDCPIVFANNAFLDLTGYEEHEIVGRNCRFLQGAGTDRAAVDRLRQATEDRQPIALEILNYRRDGTPFWNAIFMGPVYDTAGEVLYFFASQLDVTRRRESEEQFRQAQKMDSIGQLTAGLAHDFNNLIHIITSSLERIGVRRDDPKAVDRYLAAANAAAERGAKLTQQLLAFARRTRLEPVGADLSALVNGFADLLESAVGSHAHLHLHLQRRLPPAMIDPSHLEMALLNVVVNARDASPNGGAIVVTTRELHLEGDASARRLRPGDYVELSVRDEGSGMPDHVKARATEPFFTTKPKGSGTGLGLAMAHGFAQQSGGRLEIDSAPGQGTTVRMLFPVAPEQTVEVAPDAAGFQPRDVDTAAPPTILIVEDDPDIAAFAREALEETGYRVVVAESADHALALFGKGQAGGAPGFGLVFTDVVMPGSMNGVALAKEIRARAPGVPVLLTTGYNDEMSIHGPQTDAMDVLGKPYRRSELLERVQAALRAGARTGPGRQRSDFGAATV